MRTYKLPDGTLVSDVHQYADSWETLCLAFEIAIPGLKVISFDPDIEFVYKSSSDCNTYKLPTDIVSKIISIYYLASRQSEALKDERDKLWKEVPYVE